MVRYLVCAIVLCCSFVRDSFAEDYLLRIECVGNDRLAIAAEDASQADALVYSVELLVEPGARFHNRVNIANRRLTCTGKLVAGDDGTFTVDAALEDNLDSDETVVIAEGVSVSAVRHTTRVNSTAKVELDKPIAFGAELTNRTDDRVSKRRFVVTLKKLDPTK